MELEKPETSQDAVNAARSRRWIDHWPVLIPVVLVGGLLWFALWFSRRAQLLEDAANVEFEAPMWALLEMAAGSEIRMLIGSPTGLSLTDGQTTPANLRVVAGFDELTHFSARDLTDADLEYLAGCTKLESLNLQPCSVTDAGVEYLTRFENLEHLWITTDQPLTNRSLEALGKLPKLNIVTLDTPDLGEVDLKPLSAVRSLDSIDVSNATIAGDELKHLAGLPGLRWLGLRNCDIGKDSLAALKLSTNGPMLILNGSNITDAHLPAIRQLPWLMNLSLQGTQVSDEACQQLLQDRPGMWISNARGETLEMNTPAAAP